MFSKREEEYLKGSLQLGKNYDKTMRRRINKKVRVLLGQSLPLLAKNPQRALNSFREELSGLLGGQTT